jgi:hypothetical protein
MLITGFTADRMLEIENGTVVDGDIDSTGHLMLVRKDGTKIDAGYFGFSAQTMPGPTDFNTITQPGSYVFLVSTDVAASANAPIADAFGFTPGKSGILLVEGNSNWIRQTWTNYNNAQDTLVRVKTNNWYAWAPANKAATQTSQGLIEIATNTEVATGTDATRAVTPAGLASMNYAVNNAGYDYLQTVMFTSSGTFTKASYPGLKAVRVKVVGGGGAGGTSQAAAAGNHSGSGGGGGGGYAEKLITAASLATSETVTVGAGGNNTSGTTGYSGGTSSFGTKAVATGGGGGETGDNTPLMIVGVGGNGGIGTTGDILAAGGAGGNGGGYATLGHGGPGGSSALGGGGQAVYSGSGAGRTAGNSGRAYGGGGSGSQTNASSTSAISGGVGAPGVVIVEVYI